MVLKKAKYNYDIKPFQFGALSPDAGEQVIEQDKFEPANLDAIGPEKNGITLDGLLCEAHYERLNRGFNIDSIVRESRGVNKAEDNYLEELVEKEVSKKIELIKEKAYEEGFSKGKEEGYQEAFSQATEKFQEELTSLSDWLQSSYAKKQDFFNDFSESLFYQVKSLAEWVILKEIKQDDYILRLMEKLVHEVNETQSLIVKANKETLEVLKSNWDKIEGKLGELKNVRLIEDISQKDPGIIIESHNAIVDGSFYAQMELVDTLFKKLVAEHRGEHDSET